MIRKFVDNWSKRLSGPPTESVRLFTSAIYAFLLLKILFLLPIASEIASYYKYHSASVLKQLIVAPGIMARQFPVTFLILVGVLVVLLLFVKRTYYFNALGFWISINVTSLSEPVANGSDYVLNLILLLSIPLTSKPILSKWKEWQPLFFNFSILMIQFHIGLIYFLSGFDKLMTDNWRNGEAISYVAGLDYYANPIVSAMQFPFSNQTIAWFTILFELLFPIGIWFKKVRIPLLIAGVIFHLGIIYFLNLPDFGLLMIICYAIFLKSKKSEVFAPVSTD
jgi:hypothetical protein